MVSMTGDQNKPVTIIELNAQLALFFGKWERHIDKRFDAYEAKIDTLLGQLAAPKKLVPKLESAPPSV
jgi:hypothetical protein